VGKGERGRVKVGKKGRVKCGQKGEGLRVEKRGRLMDVKKG
jgi:hypothetical protein